MATAAGATDRCSDEVGRDAIWRHSADIEQLTVCSAQLQPGRVQVQVAPLQGISLLLPVQHPLQPLHKGGKSDTAFQGQWTGL